uniref:Integrase catalytic domain-containing protein n=1 Tax=Tanacetum cinerariifolium TaxID=118510 RepID=A0A6L2K8D1_TANCI|nr:hypothetical protein [Tanacetum cinerariifolium]
MATMGQNHRKGKNKLAYAPKPKIPPLPKREDLAKDSVCHECGETGHWKRNFPQYLAELLNKKKNAASGAGGSGNGQRKAVEAIGVFYLCLPSGLEIVLNSCHYASSITRGVSSIYRFSIYAVSNKRAKLDLDSALLWHSKKRIEKLQHDGLLNSTDLRAFEKFVSCMSGKMARKPYTHQVERAKDLLGLIHTDVCGPFKIMSRQGANYFVAFTDDFSRYGYVYLLKHKHEVFETFKVFQKEVENQLGKTIKSLRSDHGGEYISQEFLDHLKDHEIIAHRIPSCTPQHNVLTKKVEKTPYEVWHGQAPKLSYLKVWGCKALVKRDTLTKPDKLEPRSIKCIFIEEDTHPSIDTSLNHKEDDQEIGEPQSDIVPIRRSARTRHASDHMCLYINAEEHELGDLGEPANYKAALLDLESEKWLNAMNVEIQSMKDNEVWVLVELPPNGKTIGSKWLFKKKTDMDGVVHTYKAHLVAKGYTQTSRIDYEETFSPVVDIRTIRILIDVAAYYDYEIWQMDVKTAFLIGYLNEEVYMEKPEGFVYLKYPNRRYCMENSKRESILMQEKLKLSKLQGASTPAELKRMQNVPYASAICSIMYAVRCTRPDVAFAQNVTSRFQQNPGDLHYTTVKNILKYLRNTKDMFLVYEGDLKRELRVFYYTDVGYLTDADDLKSQTGYVFILNGGDVDWKSAKLNVVPIIEETISMFCDNTGAIAIANESGITKGARHLCAKVHYLRKVIEYSDVKLEKVNTDDKLADPFTKALAFPKHSEHTRNIGMLPATNGYASLFSMRIHHGGYFTDLPRRKYVNGKENIVDVSGIEEFLVYEVDSIMKQLGYNETVEPIYYHFLIPGKDLDVGLEALGNEDDVLKFSKYVANYKLIELYTKHGVTKLNTYFMSPKANRLTFEEIVDEVRLDDDLIVDLDNAHNEPDITVFLFSLNSRVHFGGNTNLIPDDLVVEDDVDVVKNDSFDSASDSDDDLERIGRKNLRELNKEKRVDEGVVNRAKSKADVQVEGDYKLQYAMLRDYIMELHTTNANTTVRIEVEREPDHDNLTRVFKRIHVCLGAMKEGYRACQREFLGLDGAFMKGTFRCQVFTAVGIDPNNEIYPLAYDIVEAENRNSWTWFLHFLGNDLNLGVNSNFTFISDRQKGLIQALGKLFPSAEHRKRHSDVLLNNMCEVLNGKIVDSRDKPIITALEFIREYCMKRIVNVGKVSVNTDRPLTPTATRLLNLNKDQANKYTVIWNDGVRYQVSGLWGDQCVVDVVARNYTCRKSEIMGIPCKHAVATNWNMCMNRLDVEVVETWVHPCYWLDTWKQVYSFKIEPINANSMWRRKLSRYFRSVTCSQYGKKGHNKKGCVGQGQSSVQKQSLTQSSASGSAGRNEAAARKRQAAKGKNIPS